MNPSTAGTKLRLIADSILADIASGRLRSGDRIESERKLTQLFGVSLGTVQRALEDLEHRGVLTREHGRGTFVRGRGASVDARYIRFRDKEGRELPVYWHILSHSKVKTTAMLARFFGDGVPLIRIDRRIDVNGQFLLISQFFLSEEHFNALSRSADLKDDINLREFLSQRLALPTLRLEQLVGFERVPAAVSRILGCPKDQPCFAMELRGYTVEDRPLYLQRILGEPFEHASLVIDVNK
jgi:GntR family transcriptional regulator